MPTVLFVDDEPAILKCFARTLRKEPYEVLTAASSLEAMTIVGAQRVDIVVSDERMPGMSGSELLEWLRKEHPQIVRIALTGEVSLSSTTRVIRQGEPYRLLSKPLAHGELVEALRQSLTMIHLNEGSARARSGSDPSLRTPPPAYSRPRSTTKRPPPVIPLGVPAPLTSQHAASGRDGLR